MLAIGAFLMQFTVQGAWGIVPVHLNELSPADRARHLSRLRLSARQSAGVGQRDRCRPGSPRISAAITAWRWPIVAGTVAVIIAGLTAVGTEAKGVAFSDAESAAA